LAQRPGYDAGMKLIGAVLLAAAATLLGCAGFEKVPEADVDTQQKATAQKIAARIYEGCVSGKHQPLGEDEAIAEMREALSPSKLPGTCEAIKGQFGDYQSLDYAETWKPKGGSLKVYRFKGHFSKATEAPEIRVIMDGAKLSGFWLKPWADQLH
jgi:hypothetical protein